MEHKTILSEDCEHCTPRMIRKMMDRIERMDRKIDDLEKKIKTYLKGYRDKEF